MKIRFIPIPAKIPYSSPKKRQAIIVTTNGTMSSSEIKLKFK